MTLKTTSIKIRTLAVLALAAAGALAALGQGTNQLNPRDFSAFKIISDRNIFDPNRRPPVLRAPPPKVVDSFALVGTMSYGKGTFAVFNGSNSEYHKVAEVGEKIGSYAVESITSDAVKLLSGTNEVELKLGMQMRRNDDGSWSVAEASEAAGTSSYAADSSRDRGNRRDRRPGSSFGRNNSRTGPAASAPGPGNMTEPNGFAQPDTMPPPEPGGGNPNDIIEMMRQRRLQETGGGPNSDQPATPGGGENSNVNGTNNSNPNNEN